MLIFFLKRFGSMILTFFFISVMIFIIIELPPGDYADRYAFRKIISSGGSVTKTDMENLRQQFGLDKPPVQRYVNWIDCFGAQTSRTATRFQRHHSERQLLSEAVLHRKIPQLLRSTTSSRCEGRCAATISIQITKLS